VSAASSTVTVRPVRGDDPPDREAWHRIRGEARETDWPGKMPPIRELTLGPFDRPIPGQLTVRAVAEVDGEVVGLMDVDLPLLDNTDNAVVEVTTAPAYRRRGIGTALWVRALEVAREHGRRRVISASGEPADAPPGPAAHFLEHQGLDRALQENISVLDLDEVPDEQLRGLHDAAATRATGDGYELVLWTGVPSTETLAELGRLENTLTTDAPMGDLAWEPEVWEPDRVEETWTAVEAIGLRAYHAAVRHRDGGPLVGWTTLVAAPSTPRWAMQWNTVVAPQHRGHRLGMWLKTENLATLRAAEPTVRRIETENAVDNGPMLDVNVAMGFRRVGQVWEWQGDVA
jgi:GNAT superfamily N-acetyltransferase